MKQSTGRPRILVFRLSALGDVILCSSVLSALSRIQPESLIDWVISSTWLSALDGDPRITRLIPFDRRAGFLAWHRLCRSLYEEGYDEVLDLHGSLRTRYAHLYFLIRGFAEIAPRRRWRLLSKERWKRVGFFVFKGLWPQVLRPGFRGGLAVQAARVAGGAFEDRPDLSFLLDGAPSAKVQESLHFLSSSSLGFLAVMPGSAWPGKRWRVQSLADTLEQVGLPVAVLGTERDAECGQLADLLDQRGLTSVRAFESVSLRDAAHLIHASRLLVSNDTGLVHLAEALGRPAVQLFGPTHPGLGFGAWRPESRTLGANLWCRPCSKDGSICFRMGESRFLCQAALSVSSVRSAIESVLAQGAPRGGKQFQGAQRSEAFTAHTRVRREE